MRFIRYAAGGSSEWGIQRENKIHSAGELEILPPTVERIATRGYRQTVAQAIEASSPPELQIEDVQPLAPVPRPGKIVCVGLNYHDHAEEQNEEVPEKPMLFSKSPTSVTHPGRPIVHPPNVSQVDYEVELAFVIGKSAKNISEEDALDYVSGYTVLNDISARDAQFEDGQFFRGKSYDTFAPMGPVIETGDEFDPNDLSVELRVNGETKQASSTAEFIFSVEELVAYLSRVMTLEPGDVVSTGTPGGVGIFSDPPDLLEPGDKVAAEIENIGSLENTVVNHPGR